ncbi:MAG: hypothetical protein KF878_32915 [Planctomycetes bacterium]|nr:hypothetical protein [Planctomycetota bacterium]
MTPRTLVLVTTLLSALALPALAQPAPATGGLVGALGGDPAAGPLILFSLQEPPRRHAPAVLAEQMARQTRRLRELLDVAAPTSQEADLLRRLNDSIFSVARHVLNERPAPNPALARGLLPYVSEDMARALAKRGPTETGPLGPRPVLYDVARAISHNLRGPGGQVLDRALAVQHLRGLVGAVPYEGGSFDRRGRRFLTHFEVHRWFLALYPELPARGGQRFGDYIDLVVVDRPVGGWIDGLADGLTLGGRRANTGRLLARLDALEAGRAP